MQLLRLLPLSPHPVPRTSPQRHGKRFGSLTVPVEDREAAVKDAPDPGKDGATVPPTLSRTISMPVDIAGEYLFLSVSQSLSLSVW